MRETTPARATRESCSGYRVSVHAAAVVRIDVAAFFVEVNLASLLAHVDLEFARGTGTLPALVAVAHAVEAFAGGVAVAASRGHLGVEIATQAAAKIGDILDRVATAQQHDDGESRGSAL